MKYLIWLKQHTAQLAVIDFAILKLTMFGLGLSFGALYARWVDDHFYWILPAIAAGMAFLAIRFLRTQNVPS